MDAERRNRTGFALFAIVVGLVVIAVLATLMVAPLSGDNREARVERAADILHRLVAEMDSASGNTTNYFKGQMQASGGPAANRPRWPGRLSHLYTQPLTTDLRCSGATYNAAGVNVANWRGPYHLVPMRTTGHNIAPGFFADDAIVRVSNTQAYIRMQDVSLDDAGSLDRIVDNAVNATAGTVRYSPTASSPVIVEYHFASASGAPCS
jgi:type II secretory pathway pseudopilin PulG